MLTAKGITPPPIMKRKLSLVDQMDKPKRVRLGNCSSAGSFSEMPTTNPTQGASSPDQGPRGNSKATPSSRESYLCPTRAVNETAMKNPTIRGEKNIKTRFLIISDTHAEEFSPDTRPLHQANVAIHCGDLTNGSKLTEFRSAIRLLKDLNAPIKLVIAGNHDFTLDTPAFKDKITQAHPPLERDLVVKEYGDFGEAKQLFEEAKTAGIVFLEEGTHQITLDNGAQLTVYARPFTPSLGDWGFQYHPDQGHHFAIEKGVDIVVTHGPPRGIMDRTHSHQRTGCPKLFSAVARARPRLHCFGHIHEGWGGKMVAWKDSVGETPSSFDAIDNERSVLVENLATLKGSSYDTPEAMEKKKTQMARYRQDRSRVTSHCTGDVDALRYGEQTLFVNAAIEGTSEELPVQLPWLVDIELPPAAPPKRD